jgi:uncharacterized repeat protein (TIGR03943 family)
LQAVILSLLGLFFIYQIISGRITWYINARFLPLVLFGAVVMLVLARVISHDRSGDQDHEHDHQAHEDHDHQAHEDHDHQALDDHDHSSHRSGWALVLVSLPLLIGVFFPHRPLGAEVLENRGVSITAPLRASDADKPLQLELAPTERSILDWIRIVTISEDPTSYEGQSADVTGFAYRDPRLESGQILLGRFILTCCVADATAIGLMVEGEGIDEMIENQWYRIRGTVFQTVLEGQVMPVIQADQIEEVPMPEEPYLYN